MSIPKITKIRVAALKEAYSIQYELTRSGKISDLSNDGMGFDKSLRGDWDSEEVMILQKVQANKIILSLREMV